MSKHILISIKENCHLPWQDMVPNENGKHCNSCQKTVIDFTSMSDIQIVNFIKKNKANTCGRFYKDQLLRPIAIPTKTIPWLKYFFTITLPAFLWSQKANAQTVATKGNTELLSKRKVSNTALDLFKDIKKDSVINLDTISVQSNGNYKQGRIIMGDISSVGIYKILKNKETISQGINSTKTSLKPTIPNTINIYPNPITANSKLHIAWQNSVNADQLIEIFDANGSLIQSEKVTILYKTQTTFIQLKRLLAGYYIIRVTDASNLLKLSKVFLVQ